MGTCAPCSGAGGVGRHRQDSGYQGGQGAGARTGWRTRLVFTHVVDASPVQLKLKRLPPLREGRLPSHLRHDVAVAPRRLLWAALGGAVGKRFGGQRGTPQRGRGCPRRSRAGVIGMLLERPLGDAPHLLLSGSRAQQLAQPPHGMASAHATAAAAAAAAPHRLRAKSLQALGLARVQPRARCGWNDAQTAVGIAEPRAA